MARVSKCVSIALIVLLSAGCVQLFTRGANARAPANGADNGSSLDWRIAYGQYPRPVKHGETVIFCAMWNNLGAPAYVTVEHTLTAGGQLVHQADLPPTLIQLNEQGSECTSPIVVDAAVDYTWTVTVNKGVEVGDWLVPTEHREIQMCHSATGSCGLWTQPAEPYGGWPLATK